MSDELYEKTFTKLIIRYKKLTNRAEIGRASCRERV